MRMNEKTITGCDTVTCDTWRFHNPTRRWTHVFISRRDEENVNRIGTTHKHFVHEKIKILPPSKCSIQERTQYHYFLMK